MVLRWRGGCVVGKGPPRHSLLGAVPSGLPLDLLVCSGHLDQVWGKKGKHELEKLSVLALFSSSNQLYEIMFKVSK